MPPGRPQPAGAVSDLAVSLRRACLPENDERTRLIARLGETCGLWVVGGGVRDACFRHLHPHRPLRPSSDLDLATDAPVDRLAALLRALDTPFDDRDAAHGAIRLPLAAGTLTITTLREDVRTDGRHAVVRFVTSLDIDARRRDLTINALYLDPRGPRLHDPCGGLDDLAAGIVRFIGDPVRRVSEDRLRILRFFRFFTSFQTPGTSPDPLSLQACVAARETVAGLSASRIRDELVATLMSATPLPGLALLRDHAILPPALPLPRTFEPLRELLSRHPDAPATDRLAALWSGSGAACRDRIARTLCLTRVQRRALVSGGSPGGLR